MEEIIIKTIVTYNQYNNGLEIAEIIIDEASGQKYKLSTVEVTNEDETTSKKVELKAVSNFDGDGSSRSITHFPALFLNKIVEA